MWVLKVGGSILDHHSGVLDAIISVVHEMAELQRLLILVGGGVTADLIRSVDQERHLSPLASHLMSVLAMEINSAAIVEAHPEELYLTREPTLGSAGCIPVLLPLDTVLSSPLPTSWQVTSDTIAAYVADSIGAKLVLLKDVDGVLDHWPDGNVLEDITPAELSSLETSPVDHFLPRFLAEKRMEAWVLSGLRPERLESLISGRGTLCTHIRG